MTSPLDRLLSTLDVRLRAFAVCEIRPGWSLVFDAMDAVVVHHVLAGGGLLRVAGVPDPVPLDPGLMIVVPPGLGQRLEVADRAGGGRPREAAAGENCAALADGLIKFDAGPAAVAGELLVACGTITATHGAGFGLFEGLRGPLVQDTRGSEPLGLAFRAMLAELASPGVGSGALAEALMKQCLILLLRGHLARLGPASPLFAALADPRLARAVAAVLERPAHPHTLQGLAAAAGMSRSSFAERFGAAFGQSPLDFVRRVRLREAARLLATTALPVKLVAASVGYASRSRFSQAFSDAYGLDPTGYRGKVGVLHDTPPGEAAGSAGAPPFWA